MSPRKPPAQERKRESISLKRETEHLYSRHPIHRIGGGGVPFAASETVTPLTS